MLRTGTSASDTIVGDYASITTTGYTPEGKPILLLYQDYSDNIVGLSGNDTLSGGYGHDLLDGGSGNDILYGFGSTNVPDGSLSIVFEGLTVATNGNHFKDDDIIYGGDGNDFIYGDGEPGGAPGGPEPGDDQLFGGNGNDVIHGGGGNDSLDGGSGVDKLYGEDGNDQITYYGSIGGLIDAGRGDDTVAVYGAIAGASLQGGSGTDTISFQGAVIDRFSAANGFEVLAADYGVANGTDTANVLDFSGLARTSDDPGSFTIHGGGGNDTITGTSGFDIIYGDDGNDALSGGAGDQLFGGEGADTFILSTIQNFPVIIVDFEQNVDHLALRQQSFGFSSAGALPSSAFAIGPSAPNLSDRIFYNAITGGLYFDPDGSGSAKAFHIADLSPALSLSSKDLQIV